MDTGTIPSPSGEAVGETRREGELADGVIAFQCTFNCVNSHMTIEPCRTYSHEARPLLLGQNLKKFDREKIKI